MTDEQKAFIAKVDEVFPLAKEAVTKARKEGARVAMHHDAFWGAETGDTNELLLIGYMVRYAALHGIEIMFMGKHGSTIK